MYAGRPVEKAPVDELFARPRMPYTIGLLGAVPRVDAAHRAPLVPITGNPPLLVDLPPGCPFAPRCPLAIPDAPDAANPSSPPVPGTPAGHSAACIRADRIEDGRIDGAPRLPAPRRCPSRAAAAVPREQRPTVLELTAVSKTYPLMKGALLKRRVGTVSRGLDDRPRHPGGRDPRPGRRVRLRQDHDAAGDPEPAAARARHHPRLGVDVADAARPGRGAALRRDCRSCSRTRWPRWTRGCPSSTSSPSRCAPSA